MALCTQIICQKCGNTKHVWHSAAERAPLICHDCVAEELADERGKHLAELAALPLAERIAKLEAWAYDFEKQWRGTLSGAAINQARY